MQDDTVMDIIDLECVAEGYPEEELPRTLM